MTKNKRCRNMFLPLEYSQQKLIQFCFIENLVNYKEA